MGVAGLASFLETLVQAERSAPKLDLGTLAVARAQDIVLAADGYALLFHILQGSRAGT